MRTLDFAVRYRARPMVRFNCWPTLLLVIVILTRADAVSDQCKELQGEIVGIRKLNHRKEVLLGQCYEQLKAETHISEAAFRSLKLEEDDFKSKLKESDGVINNMKKQLERKDAVLQNCNETLGQLNRTVQELVEKEKELQATIDGQTKTLNANNRTVQELGEIRKQLQANIDGLTKTVEALNRTVQLLCEHPKDACRCLLATAKTGDVNRTKTLVKYASENCTGDDEFRNTPLMYAARYGHVDVVRLMLEGGADAKRANAVQRTALHMAAWSGYLEVCRLLLDCGAKVDPQDKLKETPLHDAARQGHLSVVKLLVERGADVRVKNDYGMTASKVAWRFGMRVVADWLDSVPLDKVL